MLEHYPEIKDAMVERDWDFMSHGIYNTRYLNTLSEEQEREFYRDCIATFKRETGKDLKGMLGPALSNSDRTPDLMAEAGLILSHGLEPRRPACISHSPTVEHSGKLISVPLLGGVERLRDVHPNTHDYSPIISTGRLCKWPNGARVAFWIAQECGAL